MHQMQRMRILRNGFAYVLLTLMSIVSLAPLLWMVSTSLKSRSETFVFPPKWIPDEPQWSNYVDAWQAGGLDFGRMFINTGLVVLPVTVCTVLASSLAAYGFARVPFQGSNILFILLLVSLMIPVAPTLIPQFILFRELGWLNTLWPLIVPGLFGNAFAIFLMRQFFLTIPGDLEDAALLDGATRFRVWREIFLPLSKPVIATLAIFTFQFVYNDFLGPLIFLNSSEKFTVQLGLAAFNGVYQTRYDLLMAASVFTLAPIVLLFLFAQRYFIESINLSGMKG